MIKIIKTTSEFKNYRKTLGFKTVGFVPTMGSLHQGHFELIHNSKKNNEITVVSIFVNPTQFNNRNDFDTYPNNLQSDIAALEKLNVDVLFLPTEEQMYPEGYRFKLTENLDSLDLCGSARPGHFDGVLTVVLKLINLIQPSDMYMGLKDFQQYKLLKDMARDLFLDLKVHGVETVREESGLAMSSRNMNLTAEQKKIAEKYAQIFAQDLELSVIKSELEKLDLRIDYLVEKQGRKFVAVFIGDVRLIDNRSIKNTSSNVDGVKSLHQINETQEKRIDFKNNAPKLNSLEVSDKPRKILFKMSASIACYKACEVLSKLVQMGHEVRVAATPDVFQFVGKATLEGLVGSAVYSDMYADGEMMSHIHLNDWCDLTVLCPASANTMIKISLGLSDNIVTALALATDSSKPYLVFPAMNARMFESLPLQTAITNLTQAQKKIILGEPGHLACGHVGAGRLAEPEYILKVIEENFEKVKSDSISKTKKKILITAGGTSEPIDPVRFVSNTSTGKTGLTISKKLSQDFDVYLLGAESLKGQSKELEGIHFIDYFKSFVDLESKLKTLLSEFDFEAIVHLAAVSDYSPSRIHFNKKSVELPMVEKISSSEEFIIEFKQNKKLISEIKNISKNKNIKIIGFKLLRTDDSEKIQYEIEKILKDSDCVVVNSLENISDKKHSYEIYNLAGLVFHGNTKEDLAQDISKILNGEALI